MGPILEDLLKQYDHENSIQVAASFDAVSTIIQSGIDWNTLVVTGVSSAILLGASMFFTVWHSRKVSSGEKLHEQLKIARAILTELTVAADASDQSLLSAIGGFEKVASANLTGKSAGEEASESQAELEKPEKPLKILQPNDAYLIHAGSLSVLPQVLQELIVKCYGATPVLLKPNDVNDPRKIANSISLSFKLHLHRRKITIQHLRSFLDDPKNFGEMHPGLEQERIISIELESLNVDLLQEKIIKRLDGI